jgi:hypothetical protein
VACPQLDISAYLFVVSRGVSAPQRVLRESVKPGGAIYGRGAEWDHRFPSWCVPLQRHDSSVLKLPPVLEHGCRQRDELGRLRDLSTNRPHNTLGQLTVVSYRPTTANA